MLKNILKKRKNHVIFLQPFGYFLNMVNLAHFFYKNPLHELQIGFFRSPKGKRLPKKHWWKSSNVCHEKKKDNVLKFG
jgi:hypothetical protein